ncbi:hypothetical protein SLA2020_491660 [Shorea laevis]
MAGGGSESSLRLTNPRQLRWDLLFRMEISEVGIGTEDVQAALARFSQSLSRKFFQLFLSLLFGGSPVARTEGMRALWKGMTPFATHLTLKYALRMGSNVVFHSLNNNNQVISVKIK